MVWIDNHAIVRQYFADIVKAREMAVAWLEEHPNDYKVFFYRNKESRNYNAYVLKEKISGRNYYMWAHYTSAYGMVQVPLNKNGKIRRH